MYTAYTLDSRYAFHFDRSLWRRKSLMLGLQSQVICSAQDTFEARDEVEALIRKAWWRGGYLSPRSPWIQDECKTSLDFFDFESVFRCGACTKSWTPRNWDGGATHEGKCGDVKAAKMEDSLLRWQKLLQSENTAESRKFQARCSGCSGWLRLSETARGVVKPMLLAPG